MVVDSILGLPLELVSAILAELDWRDILVCKRVCKYFNTVVNSSLELQYKIELGAEQLLDNPNNKSLPTTADRLQLLRDRRTAWRNVQWCNYRIIKMSGICDAYELVGGIFAKTERRGGTRGPKYFTASILPSRTHPHERRFVHEDLGVETKDFAIDPSQNLLALLEFHDFGGFWGGSSSSPEGYVKIHLRTLWRNERHPEAKVPLLYHKGRRGSPMSAATLQIVDDVVGKFTLKPEPLVVIWNWKTGEKLVESGNMPLGRDLAFISPRAFIVSTIKQSGEIWLYSFSNTSLHDLPDSSPAYLSNPHRGLELVAILSLPPLADDCMMEYLTTHTGPFMANPSAACAPLSASADGVPYGHGGDPFYTADEARVHVLTAEVGNHAFNSLYRLVIHNRVFERVMEEWRLAQKEEQEQKSGEMNWSLEKAWEEWGPDDTRMFMATESYRWLRYVHGSRVVFPLRLFSQASSRRVLRVFDFNPNITPTPPPPPPEYEFHRTEYPLMVPAAIANALNDAIDGTNTTSSSGSTPSASASPSPLITNSPPLNIQEYIWTLYGPSPNPAGRNDTSDGPSSSTFVSPLTTTSKSPESSSSSSSDQSVGEPVQLGNEGLLGRNRGSKGKLIEEETTINDEMFKASVVTRLKYWMGPEVWDSYTHAGFMCDEQRLIGMEVDPNIDENIGDLHVLLL